MSLENNDINNENEFGSTALGHALYTSQPSEIIGSILDKGGKFGRGDQDIVEIILDRVTGTGYRYQLKTYGETYVKNNLENIAVLRDRGLIKDQAKLNILLSNPELFDKYPETMKKVFENEANLSQKIKEVKKRLKNKEENKDYLEEKMKLVDNAARSATKRKIVTDELGLEHLSKQRYRKNETGNSTDGTTDQVHKKIAGIREDVAKIIMENHLKKSNS